MTAGNDVFRQRPGAGWTRGLDVLLRAELSGWFRTRKWWVQILVWAGMINGLLFLIASSERQASATLLVELFTVFLGTFAPIGVAVLMQSVLVGEKRSGTAAWVLSKPASRAAFVLAKLVAHTAGIAVALVLAQGLLAYGIIYLITGTALSPLGFLLGLGVHLAHLLFYLCLSLVLGVFISQRGVVIGLPIVVLAVQQWVEQLVPRLGPYLPWNLVMPPNGGGLNPLASAVIWGTEPATYLPLITVLGGSALFVAVALWAIRRVEF